MVGGAVVEGGVVVANPTARQPVEGVLVSQPDGDDGPKMVRFVVPEEPPPGSPFVVHVAGSAARAQAPPGLDAGAAMVCGAGAARADRRGHGRGRARGGARGPR